MSTPQRAEIDVVLRPGRQMTLPAAVCKALGLHVGDHLALSVTDGGVVMTPKRVVALRALEAIQDAFGRAGISEEALQEEGRRVRARVSRARYGNQ